MASNPTPVLLLFGAGRNTGLATAKKFAGEGYKVAAVSRHPYEELKNVASLIIPADLKDPAHIGIVFDKVAKELGTPHVVIYNGESRRKYPEVLKSPAGRSLSSSLSASKELKGEIAYDSNIIDSQNPLQVPADRLMEALAVNTASPHEAARLAVKGFTSLPEGTAKTFLFTGNPYHQQLNTTSILLGIGKTATAYWVEAAAKTPGYQRQGFRFYYVDERTPEGGATNLDIDGEAHAVEFWRLSHEIKEQSHWDWTFVKGTPGGYVPFEAQVARKIKAMELPFELPEGGISIEEFIKRLTEHGIAV